MGGPSSVILVVQMPGISCGGRFDCGVFSFKIVLFEWMVFEVGLYPLLSMPSMMVNCEVMFWVPCAAGEEGLEMGWVLGLLIREVHRPPRMARDAKAVWGMSWPKTTVDPIKGAPSSQKRAQQIVEKEVIFFLSSETSSTVQVVSILSVVEMAIFETMAEHISRATFGSSPITLGFGTSQPQ